MALFVFQFYLVCNFGKFINYGPGTIKSERVKEDNRLLWRRCLNIVILLRCGKYIITKLEVTIHFNPFRPFAKASVKYFPEQN